MVRANGRGMERSCTIDPFAHIRARVILLWARVVCSEHFCRKGRDLAERPGGLFAEERIKDGVDVGAVVAGVYTNELSVRF
mmetsp:Transcript_8009/g.12705  ORF Transcript_8009/g.12705 Transcript_8009/m.12705 type:complete len:81 (-) Transcript_8009:1418-1660(-)